MSDLPEVFVEVVGAGQRVGSSCTIVRVAYPGSPGVSCMMDFGLGLKDGQNLPPNLHRHFKVNSSAEVRRILMNDYNVQCLAITHHHYDHCAAVPLLVNEFNWDRPILASFPTLSMMQGGSIPFKFSKIVEYSNDMSNIKLDNYVHLTRPVQRGERVLLGRISDSNDKSKAVNVYVYFIYGGHVLGASQIVVEIDNPAKARIIYSGDVTVEGTDNIGGLSLLSSSNNIITILISEGTYASHTRRESSETNYELWELILKTIQNKGKVFIPSGHNTVGLEMIKFITGMLRHSNLKTPIYVAQSDKIDRSGTWQRLMNDEWGSLSVSKHKDMEGMRYGDTEFGLEGLNDNIMFLKSFADQVYSDMASDFCKNHHKDCLSAPNGFGLEDFMNGPDTNQSLQKLNDQVLNESSRAAIIIAGPQHMSYGASRDVLCKISPYPENAIFIPGYCMSGTLGHYLQHATKGKRIVNQDRGEGIEVKAKIRLGSFSSHPDCGGMMQYITGMNPSSVVFVHGDKCGLETIAQHLRDLNPLIDVRVPADNTIYRFNLDDLMKREKDHQSCELLDNTLQELDEIASSILKSDANETWMADLKFGIGIQK